MSRNLSLKFRLTLIALGLIISAHLSLDESRISQTSEDISEPGPLPVHEKTYAENLAEEFNA